MSSDAKINFATVLRAEVESINARQRIITDRQNGRARQHRDEQSELRVFDIPDRPDVFEARIIPPSDVERKVSSDPSSVKFKTEPMLSGVALSGGGIRSAAYCLGVLQALDAVVPDEKPQILEAVDYLSTVSGGGYIGISYAAAVSKSDNIFPFKSKLDQGETVETQHLRDYSNYLVPGGGMDLVAGLVMLGRGLLVNAIVLLSVIYFGAALTVWVYPNEAALQRSFVPIAVGTPFGLFIALSTIFGICQFVYAVAGFRRKMANSTDLRQRENFGFLSSVVATGILLVGAAELQAYVLKGIIDAAQLRQHLSPHFSGSLGLFLYDHLFKYSSPWAALVVAVAAFGTFGSKLMKVVQATIGDKTWSGFLMHWGSRIAIYVGALLVPLAIWAIYLRLCYLVIEWPNSPNTMCRLAELPATCRFVPPTPGWPLDVAGRHLGYAWVYFLVFVLLGTASLFVSPNANSLHGYYRDRLSRAFLWSRDTLIKSTRIEDGSRSTDGSSVFSKADKPDRQADEMKISTLRNLTVKLEIADHGDDGIDTSNEANSVIELPMDVGGEIKAYSPYLIINTSVNLEGSKYLNRRGRNADSFFFSPYFTGSEATGYVDTTKLQELDVNIDLATIMAISGAAASANMGANTIRPMTFSLAVLNVRLGYWLPNPARISALKGRLQSLLSRVGPLYFTKEVFGMLDEHTNNVYLTDGGHFDNLGLYQLMKRRCKVIIAVDAEADAPLNFDSLIRLERYARIDLGIRIDLPWEDLRRLSQKITNDEPHGPTDDITQCVGPHIAVGKIEYGDEEPGVLIYIKSCVSGDESDLIRDYRRRNSSFPHETTLDQFFTEEQFEVYRALGFHATHNFLSGQDRFAARRTPTSENWPTKVGTALKRLNVPESAIAAIVERQTEFEVP